MASKWKDVAADKVSRLHSTIPKEWKIDKLPGTDSVFEWPRTSGFFTQEELGITGSTATELVSKLAQGSLRAEDVTRAFCKRAAVAQQLTNCVHEFFPDEAIAQAKALDRYYDQNRKPIGPLHGLPVSLKDQLRVKGHETSMGYVAWLGKIDEEDSTLTHLLRQAGAVLYVKTSVPQTLMVCETINNIVGRTVNPRNKDWSSGGSSGGEGVMVGFRGSLIGVGTDIGGSIRVPAAFNFCYGIRPSHGRMPYGKMANSMQGQETIHSVVGPIAHSVEDLRLFMKSVIAQKPWEFDSKVVPLPWNQGEEDSAKAKARSGKLTIGFYNNDGNVMPHPPVLRGLDLVVDTLKKSGHSVVPWQPHKHAHAVGLVSRIFASDGSTDVMKDINASGEPTLPNFEDLIDPKLGKMDMNDLWDTNSRKWEYQMEYLERWRQEEQRLGKEIDAIVAPITPTAAIRHNQFKYYGYASVINLLDFTSVVVPVTFADKTIDHENTSHQPQSEMDKSVQAEYDAEAYHNAPVAVQVIGRRLSEEKTMAIAEEIGRLLGNSVTP